MNWASVQQLHASVAADVAAAAGRVPSDKWLVPRAEGKWSPAEVVEHLNLAYDVLLRELAGGGGMEVRTKLWRRLLWRFTIMPRLLRGDPFPPGVRAPREIRPALPSTDQHALIESFRERAARFESAVAEARKKPNSKLTHAYFGSSTVRNGMLFCTRHMQHHLRQIS